MLPPDTCLSVCRTPRTAIRVPHAYGPSSLATGAKTPAEIAEITGLSPNTVNRVIKQMTDVMVVGKGGPRKNAAIYGLKEERSATPPANP